MTQQQQWPADIPALDALWQWLGVALTHAATHHRVPYVEPLLYEAFVTMHNDHIVNVRFYDGTVIHVELRAIDTVPLGGAELSIIE